MLFRISVFAWMVLVLPWLEGAQCIGPSELEQAIQTNPSANAYNALGAWFAQRRQFACAIPAFDKALQLNPNSWETHFNLGLALMENHGHERAVSEFRLAVKLRPDSVRARSALGAALQELRQFGEAESEFNSALKLDPQSVYTLDHLAQVYSAERRYALAIEKWNLAIHLAPTDPDLQIELAVAYSNNGNSKRAIEILADLTRSAPDLALAHFNLATVYADEKRFR